MSWGAIYSQSWWGRAIKEDFGDVYEEYANPSPVAGLLTAIKDRSTYYENEAGTISLLEQLENCELVTTYGEELIVNGDFSSLDISHITGAGDRIVENNKLKISENGLNYSQVIISNILDSSKKYKLTFDISVGTGVYNAYGTTIGTPSFTSSGTYEFILENTSRFYLGSNGAGDIWYLDNVSVKEIIQTA